LDSICSFGSHFLFFECIDIPSLHLDSSVPPSPHPGVQTADTATITNSNTLANSKATTFPVTDEPSVSEESPKPIRTSRPGSIDASKVGRRTSFSDKPSTSRSPSGSRGVAPSSDARDTLEGASLGLSGVTGAEDATDEDDELDPESQ
jgi:hypothetical protein